jgi:hypothetical protein
MGRGFAVTLAGAAVVVYVAGCANSKASRGPEESAAALAAFSLVPPHGIVLWMHPTQARIVVSVGPSGGRLKVCEVGTTFSYYWRGGCRRFVGGHAVLPSSGGAVHIGFRIVPTGKRAVKVDQLHVRWHCVDHLFVVQRGSTKARLRGQVVFDC